ncbi:FAD-binding oxidoreductase [Phragmitibacter flavus]|nr:FAD-binding oxidoreductase [Phragmitibacter flavus]
MNTPFTHRLLSLLIPALLWLSVQPSQAQNVTLNDVHSRLNPTSVAEVLKPTSTDEVIAAIHRAKATGKSISIAGSRHAMGGQQFAADALHLDMTSMDQFLSLDPKLGLARAQAGITWPKLLKALEAAQPPDNSAPWTITQKQTGADELTLGGAVSTNIHGRGLTWQPFVQDIESLTLVNASGETQTLSRTQNRELFSLVIGGYGLFGVITEVELRLRLRQNLERIVEIGPITNLQQRIAQRIQDGYLLGDFQFCPDETSLNFLNEGVFACYRPTTQSAPSKSNLNPAAWNRLLINAHSNRTQGWLDYTTYYQTTHGQTYGSDQAQFNHYDPDYHTMLQKNLPDLAPGSLMISEVYVPAQQLEDFMTASAADFRQHQTQVIYGTIRFIKRDDVTFLPWASQDFACIVFNLRVTHTESGIAKAKGEFQRLIDRALDRNGSFFLTYHRWATKAQMIRAYPQFPEFLQLKKQHDPEERFQSEWYRHWRNEFNAAN